MTKDLFKLLTAGAVGLAGVLAAVGLSSKDDKNEPVHVYRLMLANNSQAAKFRDWLYEAGVKSVSINAQDIVKTETDHVVYTTCYRMDIECTERVWDKIYSHLPFKPTYYEKDDVWM